MTQAALYYLHVPLSRLSRNVIFLGYCDPRRRFICQTRSFSFKFCLPTIYPYPTAHLPALAGLGSKGLPLKAVYSRSEQSARDFAGEAQKLLGLSAPPDAYFDTGPQSLDALLARDDIAAVVVVLPITTQPSVILKALEAGKHVLSEKPVAPDVQQGSELIKKYNRLYKPKGLIWRVAENFEAEDAYRAARAFILSGKIGTIVSFKATVINYIDQDSQWYKTAWRTVPDVSTCGPITHHLDKLLRFFHLFIVPRWIFGMQTFIHVSMDPDPYETTRWMAEW